jgi:hypothetical protein
MEAPPWSDLPPVHFYFPRGLPEPYSHHTRWLPGQYVWTVKTQALLAGFGFPCRLTDQLPDDGIIVTHRELLPNSVRPNHMQLFVCAVADNYRHPYAQLHVVQNHADPMLAHRSPMWPAAFMPHWPETALVPRDPSRGNMVRNVAYFGLESRLAPQLRGPFFASKMRAHGFAFRVVGRDQWHDYSDTDVVLAVRSFAPVSFHKFPPTKLYNAWIAGVPALLGHESAYQAERRGPLDYFEVRGIDDIVRALHRLRSEPGLFGAVQRNAAERAAGVTPERIALAWAGFLSAVAAPAYAQWRRRSAAGRAGFLTARTARYAGFTASDLAVRAIDHARKRAWALRAT